MSQHLQVSTDARQDIRAIYIYTTQRYSREQAKTYRSLIEQALVDLENNPTRLGSTEIPEIGEGVRGYRLSLATQKTKATIKKPRHIIIYTEVRENTWYVLRILHDSMDFQKHISNDYEINE